MTVVEVNMVIDVSTSMSVEVVISVLVVVAEEMAVELKVSVLATVVAVTPRRLQIDETLVAGRRERKAVLVERSGQPGPSPARRLKVTVTTGGGTREVEVTVEREMAVEVSISVLVVEVVVVEVSRTVEETTSVSVMVMVVKPVVVAVVVRERKVLQKERAWEWMAGRQVCGKGRWQDPKRWPKALNLHSLSQRGRLKPMAVEIEVKATTANTEGRCIVESSKPKLNE